MGLHSGGYYRVSVHGVRKLEHRHVMEVYLGRPLTDLEHVHHINGDKTDNRIENLQLISNSDHGKLHTKDMSNRVCLVCGSSKAYIDKSGHLIWRKHPITKEEFVCGKCHKRLSRSL